MTRRLGFLFLVAGAALGLGGALACSGDGDANPGNGSDGGSGSPGDASPDGGASPGDGATSGDASAADAAADSGGADSGDGDAGVPPATFILTSTAFATGSTIPAIHTCNGINVSPALAWSGAPAGTQSYAVVMRDLSLAGANYHWVIYDIPAAITSLAQGIEKAASPGVPAGAKQTQWSFGNAVGYSGPCPPALHDYRFTVYAIPTATLAGANGTADPAAADLVIQAQQTGSATLDGKYQQ